VACGVNTCGLTTATIPVARSGIMQPQSFRGTTSLEGVGAMANTLGDGLLVRPRTPS
jgi:hypothetical protein